MSPRKLACRTSRERAVEHSALVDSGGVVQRHHAARVELEPARTCRAHADGRSLSGVLDRILCRFGSASRAVADVRDRHGVGLSIRVAASDVCALPRWTVRKSRSVVLRAFALCAGSLESPDGDNPPAEPERERHPKRNGSDEPVSTRKAAPGGFRPSRAVAHQEWERTARAQGRIGVRLRRGGYWLS